MTAELQHRVQGSVSYGFQAECGALQRLGRGKCNVRVLQQLLAVDTAWTERVIEQTLQRQITIAHEIGHNHQCYSGYLHQINKRRHKAGLRSSSVEQPVENGRCARDALHHAGGKELTALLHRASG